MLRHTFQHLPKIGPKTEARLWEEGITDWSILLDLPEELLRGTPVRRDQIDESFRRLHDRDVAWFTERLPSSEAWRTFEAFRRSVAYIDIETNGLSHRSGGEITTICLWDGRTLRSYVQGENLRDFQDDILDYRLLVTYNGSSFDLPFIENWFQIELPHGHIDLRHVLASLGFRGGLKKCEEQIGLTRGELSGVDGEYAVHLWNRWIAYAEQPVLDTLIAYNALDVIGLEVLMVRAWNLKRATFPWLEPSEIPEPPEVPLPCAPPSPEVIDEIRREIEGRRDGLRSMVREMLSGSSRGDPE